MERRSDTTGNVESIFVEDDGTERKCTGTALPELMTFKDAEGSEHKIFMAIGTHESAYQHFMHEDWDELKKFPEYGIHPLPALTCYGRFANSALLVGQKHAKADQAVKAAGSEQKNETDAGE